MVLQNSALNQGSAYWYIGSICSRGARTYRQSFHEKNGPLKGRVKICFQKGVFRGHYYIMIDIFLTDISLFAEKPKKEGKRRNRDDAFSKKFD